MVLNTTGSDVERLMRDGQAAAKRGDKVMARALLTQLLERDPHNEKAWMWLSGAVNDLFEQQTCLENVLIINPNNSQARKGLEFVVTKTGVPSQVLDTLKASPPAPVVPASADPFAGMVPASQAPFASALDNAPWATTITEHTSPLQDAPDLADFALPEPGGGVLPPWEQLPVQPPPANLAETDAPWSAADTLSPNLTSIGMADAPVDVPMPDLAQLTDGWDAGLQPFTPPSGESDPFTGQDAALPAASATPDANAPVPDWMRQAQSQPETQAQVAEPFDLGGVEPFTPFEVPPAPAIAATGSLPAEDLAGVENGIDAWLSQVAGQHPASTAQEPSDLPPAGFPVPSSSSHAPEHEPARSNEPPVRDPFAATDMGPMGPYTANALPTPDELPGGHTSSGQGQPWYLQGSSEQIAAPPDLVSGHNWTSYGGQDEGEADNNAAQREPVATIECPNCRKHVPETSLACPECRYNFFVHCPSCHELIDTSEARPGVVDKCPYCSIAVNRFELGLMYARDLTTPTLAAPTEDKEAWIGTVHEPPKSGFHFNFAWVVDVLWLLAIALVVWALTQLPAWFNMANLYN